jgi:hypothetical protein
MTVEETLISEIEQWKKRIGTELEGMQGYGKKGREMLQNINAYVKDSSHFREKGDLVRSFEAIIWAWAWLEIGKDLQFLAKEYVDIRKIGR